MNYNHVFHRNMQEKVSVVFWIRGFFFFFFNLKLKVVWLGFGFLLFFFLFSPGKKTQVLIGTDAV